MALFSGLQNIVFWTSLLLFSYCIRAAMNVSYTTLYVNPLGNGTFKTIQDAVNHVPANNTRWIRIHVEAGEYKEQVTIPKDKPFLYIQGMGEQKTKVEWNRSDKIISDATFMSLADNIVVKNITFINTYNYPPEDNKNPRRSAVAVKVSGDKTTFYGVTFFGVQDTLFDDKGRHYFHSCTIQGAVDFIFGAGQSIYERCTISVNSSGAITAQGRENASDTNGFVFKHCMIVGNGSTLLGRAWREYSRVFFLYTTMANIIAPEGWFQWNAIKSADLTFGEYNCTGPGANTAGRVKWETQVTRAMAEKFGNLTYVDQEGTNPN